MHLHIFSTHFPARNPFTGRDLPHLPEPSAQVVSDPAVVRTELVADRWLRSTFDLPVQMGGWENGGGSSPNWEPKMGFLHGKMDEHGTFRMVFLDCKCWFPEFLIILFGWKWGLWISQIYLRWLYLMGVRRSNDLQFLGWWFEWENRDARLPEGGACCFLQPVVDLWHLEPGRTEISGGYGYPWKLHGWLEFGVQ